MPEAPDVIARLSALEERVKGAEKLMDERDRRYEGQHKAVEATAVETKKSQADYNAQHNDLIRKGEAQAALQMPRSEIEGRLHSLADKIDDLKGGTAQGAATAAATFRANVATLVAVGSLIFALWKATGR